MYAHKTKYLSLPGSIFDESLSEWVRIWSEMSSEVEDEKLSELLYELEWMDDCAVSEDTGGGS